MYAALICYDLVCSLIVIWFIIWCHYDSRNGEPFSKHIFKSDASSNNNPTPPAIKQEPITEKLPVRKKRDRFNGMTEEEVLKRTLPDHVAHNLDIIIVSMSNNDHVGFAWALLHCLLTPFICLFWLSSYNLIIWTM